VLKYGKLPTLQNIETFNYCPKNWGRFNGIIPIEINFIETVLGKIVELENVSRKFLLDWRNEQLNPVINQDIEH
jgi:hypothetical protein